MHHRRETLRRRFSGRGVQANVEDEGGARRGRVIYPALVTPETGSGVHGCGIAAWHVRVGGGRGQLWAVPATSSSGVLPARSLPLDMIVRRNECPIWLLFPFVNFGKGGAGCIWARACVHSQMTGSVLGESELAIGGTSTA